MFKYLCLFLLLSACGFQPLYMRENSVLTESAAVQIEPVAGEGGYQFGLILADKLNPDKRSVSKKYKLIIALGLPKYTNQSIRSDNFASLEKMDIKAQYQLINLKDNKVLISSSVSSNGLFNLIKDPYATVMAKDKLYENLIQLMADDIATHVLAYFKGVHP